MLDDPVGVVGLGVIELVNTVADVGTGIGNASSAVHVAHSALLLPRQNFVFDNINSIIFVKYYAVASISILYFDYLLTLTTEIRRIWTARFSGATLLFLLNRYVPLVGYIPVIVSLFDPPWSIESCNRFAPYVGAISTFGQFVISIILVLRTFALYGRNVWILLFTGAAGIATTAIGAWASSVVTGQLFSFKPFVICVPILVEDQRLTYTWIATFLFDFLIFLLTIVRTYALARTQTGFLRSGIVILVMRDGSIYFLVMSIVNAVNFILFRAVDLPFFASATGTTSIMANIISVTMMSHLLLNLRQDPAHFSRHHDDSAPNASSGFGGRMRNPLGQRGVATSWYETGTELVFTTRIWGNLTAELREGGSWEEEEWREWRGYRGGGERMSREGRARRRASWMSGESEGRVVESGGDEVEELELRDRVRTRDRTRSKSRSPSPGSSRSWVAGGTLGTRESEGERERDRWKRISSDRDLENQQRQRHEKSVDDNAYIQSTTSRPRLGLQTTSVSSAASPSSSRHEQSDSSYYTRSPTLVPMTPPHHKIGESFLSPEKERFLRVEGEQASDTGKGRMSL